MAFKLNCVEILWQPLGCDTKIHDAHKHQPMYTPTGAHTHTNTPAYIDITHPFVAWEGLRFVAVAVAVAPVTLNKICLVLSQELPLLLAARQCFKCVSNLMPPKIPNSIIRSILLCPGLAADGHTENLKVCVLFCST